MVPSLQHCLRLAGRRGALRGRLGAIAIVSALTGSQSACYRYQAAAFIAVRPGADVRVEFAPEMADAVTPLLGPKVRFATGQVQEMLGDTAMVVLLDDITTTDGDVLPWRRGRVTLPSRLLRGAEQRTLDRRRTRTSVVAAVVTFAAVVIAAIRGAGYTGSSSSSQGGAPPE
ncbi:MAG: hypothetical protein KJT01_08990 [Gemmatimonadetes bacterium]|nr:hypothetical protein [Gemmatimonadota bacterium]